MPCWLRKELQHKLKDIQLSLRGILRGFGLKVGKVTDKTFEAQRWATLSRRTQGPLINIRRRHQQRGQGW